MDKIVEKFSRFAASNVVLVYLAAMGLGTASYFVGKVFGLDPDVARIVGFATAAAVETHSLLSQRLTRRLWQKRVKLDPSEPEFDSVDMQFKIHLGITTGLVAFSVFNAIAFWALVTHPQGAGDWIQVAIRGLVIPLAFLAAGFLVPLEYDATALLSEASHKMLKKTVKLTTRQWNRRIARARKQGIDLAPIAISLMEDAGERDGARRIRLISDGLSAAEGGIGYRPPLLTASDVQNVSFDRPPTGPGTPSAAKPRGKARTVSGDGNLKPISLRMGRPRKDNRTAYARIAAFLATNPDASVREIEKGAKVSSSTASKWRGHILAEMRQSERQQLAR